MGKQQTNGLTADVQASIRDILLHEWDPIGIKDTFECRDEYDDYIGGVYRLLARNATVQEIADHLYHIESQQMLLRSRDQSALLAVANKLKAIHI